MRLGLYQTNSPAGDVSAGLSTLDESLAEADAASVDMLVLPELFLPGYCAAVSGICPPGLVASVQEVVRRHGCALTIGLPEQDGNCVFNSAYCFAPDGQERAIHRKLQLFGPDEAKAFAPGQAYTVFEYMGIKVGLCICYDVEFPEHVRALKRKGAEVILVPTANMMPFVNVHHMTVPARALENGVTIVYANYCGIDGDLSYTGLSGIYGPDGYLLAGKGQGAGLCVAGLPDGWREHGVPLSTQLQDLRQIGDPT